MEFWNSSGGVARATECYPSTTAINLGEIANTVARINVFSNSTPVNIPAVAMDVRNDRPTASILNVFVTNENVQNIEDQIDTAGGINFAGLNLNANDEHRVRFAGYITGNLTGNVRVGQVRRLQVDGAIQSEVFGGFAYAPDGFSVGTIQAGSIASTATVFAGNNASFVRVFGNIDGAVEVLSGNMNDLIVGGDVIGSIAVSGNIRSVDASNVSGIIAASNEGTSVRSNFALFDTIDGTVELGDVGNIGFDAVVVQSPSSGKLIINELFGGLIADSFTGTQSSGIYINSSVKSNSIILTGTIENLVVNGNLFPDISYSETFIGNNVKKMSVLGNIGGFGPSGCFTTPAILVQSIDELIVGGDVYASIARPFGSQSYTASQIKSIDIGGDLVVPAIGSVFGNQQSILLEGVERMVIVGDVRSEDPCSEGPRPRVLLSSLPATGDFAIGGIVLNVNLDVGFASASGSLQGVITTNGRLCTSTAAHAWSTQSEFVVDASPQSPMPFYSSRAEPLGGGYLAVAPYGLYESMCTPVDNSTGSDRITASSFYRGQNDNCTNNDPIKLHFYGPIQIWNPFVPAAKVELITTNGTIDVSRLVTYRINPANPRELLIEGKLDAALPPGQYRVTNSTTANQALYLIPVAGTGTPCTPAVAVSPFQYNFQLLPDCAPPYCEAETNPSQECVALPSVLCDPIDFNNDGSSFDPQDIDAFLSVFSEGPCIPSTATCNDIDFNNDGVFFDPCDTDAFNLMFQEGPCTACGQ